MESEFSLEPFVPNFNAVDDSNMDLDPSFSYAGLFGDDAGQSESSSLWNLNDSAMNAYPAANPVEADPKANDLGTSRPASAALLSAPSDHTPPVADVSPNQTPVPSPPSPIGTVFSASAVPPKRGKCVEPDCHSKAIFKTPGQLQQHIHNIHRHPLLCSWPGCKHTRPFGRESDLDRHVKTKHDRVRNFNCPVVECPAHVDGFSRKDKLLAHQRDKHLLHCQQNHCSAAIFDGDQQSHIELAHGEFECAVGFCRLAPASRFTSARLESHLESRHGLHNYEAEVSVSNMTREQSTTVDATHLRKPWRKFSWVDCLTCTPHFGTAQHTTGN